MSYFHLIPPPIERPLHFLPPCCMEADHQRPILSEWFLAPDAGAFRQPILQIEIFGAGINIRLQPDFPEPRHHLSGGDGLAQGLQDLADDLLARAGAEGDAVGHQLRADPGQQPVRCHQPRLGLASEMRGSGQWQLRGRNPAVLPLAPGEHQRDQPVQILDIGQHGRTEPVADLLGSQPFYRAWGRRQPDENRALA